MKELSLASEEGVKAPHKLWICPNPKCLKGNSYQRKLCFECFTPRVKRNEKDNNIPSDKTKTYVKCQKC
jgi:hypothetical protein